jgi:hypothetical protein
MRLTNLLILSMHPLYSHDIPDKFIFRYLVIIANLVFILFIFNAFYLILYIISKFFILFPSTIIYLFQIICFYIFTHLLSILTLYGFFIDFGFCLTVNIFMSHIEVFHFYGFFIFNEVRGLPG